MRVAGCHVHVRVDMFMRVSLDSIVYPHGYARSHGTHFLNQQHYRFTGRVTGGTGSWDRM